MMTTPPSLQAVAGRATADARVPPSCPRGGTSREAVTRWAGASRDALLLALALARWLAAYRRGAATMARAAVPLGGARPPAARSTCASGGPLRRALRGVCARRSRATRGLVPAAMPARAAPRRVRPAAVLDAFERARAVRDRGAGARKRARGELAGAVPRAPGARARLAGGALAVAAADFALGAAPASGGWAVAGGAGAAAPLAAALRVAAQRVNRGALRRFRAAAEALRASRGGLEITGAPGDEALALRAWPAAHARRTWGVEVVLCARRGAAAGLDAVATVLPRRGAAPAVLARRGDGRRLTPLGVLHGATGLAAAQATTAAVRALADAFPGPVGLARRGNYAITVEPPPLGVATHLACPPLHGGFLLLRGPLNLSSRARKRAARALTHAFCQAAHDTANGGISLVPVQGRAPAPRVFPCATQSTKPTNTRSTHNGVRSGSVLVGLVSRASHNK